MPRFDVRDLAPEMMDDLSITDARLTRALDELRAVDRWLGGSHVSLGAMRSALPAPGGRVLDVGCGGGDVLRAVATRFPAVQAVGVDLNPETVAYADRFLDAHLGPADRSRVAVRRADALRLPFPAASFDVAHAGLFLHHFDAAGAVQVLREMRRVARTVVVNDLHRHPLAYYGITALAVFSRSPMFRADGPHSVLRGFRREELAGLLRAAGLGGRLRWRWAFRWVAVAS